MVVMLKTTKDRAAVSRGVIVDPALLSVGQKEESAEQEDSIGSALSLLMVLAKIIDLSK